MAQACRWRIQPSFMECVSRRPRGSVRYPLQSVPLQESQRVLMTRAGLSRWLLSISAFVVMATLSPIAQGSGPAAPPGAGPGAAQGGPGGAGRAGGRGGGGPRGGADLEAKGPILPVSAAEQAKRFWLPAGYKMTP